MGVGVSLDDFRRRIDALDEKLIATLGERFDVCREVADFKGQNHVAVMQPARVEQVKNRCAELGLAHGLRPDFIKAMYAMIIEEVCAMEQDQIDEKAL